MTLVAVPKPTRKAKEPKRLQTRTRIKPRNEARSAEMRARNFPVRPALVWCLLAHRLAAYQAEHAEGSLRGMFRVIARDEAQHALLGHRVAEWAERSLPATERSHVASARAQAVEELFASLAVEPAPELVRVAGVPRSAQALAMARTLFAQLESLAA